LSGVELLFLFCCQIIVSSVLLSIW
jgi:hypothetical protein